MKEDVKNLQKCHQKCRKMKEDEINYSKNQKIFKKGLTNAKTCCIIGTSISFFRPYLLFNKYIRKDDD